MRSKENLPLEEELPDSAAETRTRHWRKWRNDKSRRSLQSRRSLCCRVPPLTPGFGPLSRDLCSYTCISFACRHPRSSPTQFPCFLARGLASFKFAPTPATDDPPSRASVRACDSDVFSSSVAHQTRPVHASASVAPQTLPVRTCASDTLAKLALQTRAKDFAEGLARHRWIQLFEH